MSRGGEGMVRAARPRSQDEVSSRNLRNILNKEANMAFQVEREGAFDHGQ